MASRLRALTRAAPCGLVWPEGENTFAGLYQQHTDLVRREIRRWVYWIGPEDAQDLEQEVWRAAWMGVMRYQGRCAPSTWLTSVARHVVFSWLRRRKVIGVARERQLRWATPETLICSDPRESGALDELTVADALGALDHRFEQVIRLRYFKGLSDGEIARQLALPLGTVKRRLHSGLKHLRHALGP